MSKESNPETDGRKDDDGSTLLPMLVGGLVMVVLGAIVIMQFV